MNMHPDLEKLYSERRTLRHSTVGTMLGAAAYRAAAHALALRIAAAEKIHGRFVHRFRVCPDCGKLRPVAAVECGKCEMYIAVWTRHGCDYVAVID